MECEDRVGKITGPFFCPDYTDKENINANNLEVPKLSIMPQQMKKKKKGGGYNLRKSLAWNKAFFTEEGFYMWLLDLFSLQFLSAIQAVKYCLYLIHSFVRCLGFRGAINDHWWY